MTILVATDFSPCSKTAARLALAMARRTGGSLVVLHTIEPLPIDLSGLALAPGWEQEMLAAGEAALASEAESLRKSGITVDTQIHFGSASSVILEAARKLHPGLVVLGTHGRRGTARLFLGSCAEQVVRAAPCPVLVTGAETEEAALDRWNGSQPLRLTVAVDGSGASEAALFWLRASAKATGNDVSLVRVYWPPQEADHYGLDEAWQGNDGHPDLVRLLERDLHREAQALSGAHEPPVRFRVASHNAGEAIADDVRQLGADAIVMGVPARRRSTPTGLTPASVLRSAPVPVFCVPESLRPKGRPRIPRVRSILIAYDLSEASKACILPAYGLLDGGGRAELTYVHERGPLDVLADLPPAKATLTEDERRSIEARMRAATPTEEAEHGIATHVSVAEGHFAAEAILQAAERLDVDVIALGSHGRSGVARALMGSVAEAVSRRSTRPVLIVRAPAN
jgi:nucleotide-binding universal stress UspA family protein